MFNTITQTRFGLSPLGDYRIHLSRIFSGQTHVLQDGEIVLNLTTLKVIRYIGGILEEYPVEENVVYLNHDSASNNLLMWNGSAMLSIGTSSLDIDKWVTGTYVLTTDIGNSLTFVNGPNSTLIFEGGKINGSLTGNQTTIFAPATRIFGDSVTISGSFVNDVAYPEWWGAVPSPNNIHSTNRVTFDNTSYIQRAFDSCFGTIQFCNGNYYVLSSLELTNIKTIKLHGLGLRNNTTVKNDFTSVIWTDQNIDVLIININPSNSNKGRLLIEGGEINVRECKGDIEDTDNEEEYHSGTNCYTKNAILFHPSGQWGGRISMSLVGPIGYIGRVNGAINWGSNCHCPTKHEVEDLNYKGTGIRFEEPETAQSSRSTYIFTIDCHIIGFGKGLCVDYNTLYADMTSLHVYGIMDQCFSYVYAPSRAFNGGVLEVTIQTKVINAPDGYTTPIIKGNFSMAYINPFIWDYSADLDIFEFIDTKNVRFGPRVLELMKSHYRRMGMSTRDLAAITSDEQGCLLSSMGNFDLQALGAVNTSIQSDNYTHVIDNDFLGIDRLLPNSPVEIDTNLNEFQVLYNSSPFDRRGLRVKFSEQDDRSDAFLKISCDLSNEHTLFGEHAKIQMLAVHVKNKVYKSFSNLKITVNGIERFNGSYNDIPVSNYNDIVIPMMKSNSDSFILGAIVIEFTGYLSGSNVWRAESFNVAIEGRLSRHFKENVWSASGGELGNHINYYGKPYIVGAGNFPSLQSLPSNASAGAIAVVANTYPVVKANSGWIVQNLTGTLSQLNSLNIGTLSIGQTAFVTDLGKMAVWNGTSWVDSLGGTL